MTSITNNEKLKSNVTRIIQNYLEKKTSAELGIQEISKEIDNYPGTTKESLNSLLKISLMILSFQNASLVSEFIPFLYKEWAICIVSKWNYKPFLDILEAQYPQTTKKVLQSLVQLALEDVLESFETPCLQCLVTLLNPCHYSMSCLPFVTDLHYTLIGYGFYELMHCKLYQLTTVELCHTKNPGQTRALVQSLFLLGLLPLEVPNRKDHDVFLGLVYTHLLTVPLLLSRFDEQGLKLVKKSKIFEMGASLIVQYGFLSDLDGNSILYLLANLVTYMQKVFANDSNDTLDPLSCLKSSFIPFIHYLLKQCIPFIRQEPGPCICFHTFFKWYSGKASSWILSDTDSNILLLTLSYLWSPLFLQVALNYTEFHLKNKKMAKSKSFLSFSLSSKTLVHEDVHSNLESGIHGLDFIPTIARVFVNQSVSLVHAIAFMPNTLERVWRLFIDAYPHSKEFVNVLMSQHAENDLHSFPLGHWTLFCSSCFIHFGMMDTSDIYARQEPFTVIQLYHILKVLNRYGLGLCQGKGMEKSNPQAKKLLTLLDDLNTCKPFNDKDPMAMDMKINFKNFIESVKNGQDFARKLLFDMPQIVPFSIRVDIFRLFIQADRQTLGTFRQKKPYRIHRNRILSDGMTHLSKLSRNRIKQPIKIKFISALGYDEAGIDQKGVFKEFVEETCKVAFAPELGLFELTQDASLVISPNSSLHENYLQLFYYLGRILGKALYDGLVLDIRLGKFIYSKLLGRYNFLEDLPFLDPELYKNLIFLRHYSGDVSELGLYFTVDEDYFGEIKTRDIRPNGREIKVTNDNKFDYICMMADYKLNVQCQAQYGAFVQGFKDIIPPEFLHLFSKTQDLETLMCGDEKALDVTRLKRFTVYEGGYHEKHPTILKFWKVLEAMRPTDQSAFLKFVTSSSKPPLGGFQNLSPRFTIRQCLEDSHSSLRSMTVFLGLSKDLERLPTASTCFNLLKLPPFSSLKTLKAKLLYAIHSNSGFELS